MINEITGIQVSADGVFPPLHGHNRATTYLKGKIELTLDTNKGSFIVTEKELLNYIKARQQKKSINFLP